MSVVCRQKAILSSRDNLPRARVVAIAPKHCLQCWRQHPVLAVLSVLAVDSQDALSC